MTYNEIVRKSIDFQLKKCEKDIDEAQSNIAKDPVLYLKWSAETLWQSAFLKQNLQRHCNAFDKCLDEKSLHVEIAELRLNYEQRIMRFSPERSSSEMASVQSLWEFDIYKLIHRLLAEWEKEFHLPRFK